MRTFTNKSGVIFDHKKSSIVYAEDMNYLSQFISDPRPCYFYINGQTSIALTNITTIKFKLKAYYRGVEYFDGNGVFKVGEVVQNEYGASGIVERVFGGSGSGQLQITDLNTGDWNSEGLITGQNTGATATGYSQATDFLSDITYNADNSGAQITVFKKIGDYYFANIDSGEINENDKEFSNVWYSVGIIDYYEKYTGDNANVVYLDPMHQDETIEQIIGMNENLFPVAFKIYFDGSVTFSSKLPDDTLYEGDIVLIGGENKTLEYREKVQDFIVFMNESNFKIIREVLSSIL